MRLIGRREFLHSLGLGAGAALLHPWLKPLIGTAMGQTSKQRFLFVIVYGDGMLREYIEPDMDENASGVFPISFQEATKPLESLRNKVSLVAPLNNPVGNFLHGNGLQLLTAMDSPSNEEMPGGVSFDRYLGDALRTNIQSPLLCYGTSSISAEGKDRPIPASFDPVQAYDQLFKGLFVPPPPGNSPPSNPPPSNSPTPKPARDLLREERSLLDFMLHDVKRAQRGLATAERQKLDQYVDSFRAMETKLTAIAQQRTASLSGSNTSLSCGSLPKPASRLSNRSEDDDERNIWAEEVISVLIDIAFHGLLCGRAPVASLFIHEPQKIIRVGGHQMYHGKAPAGAGIRQTISWMCERSMQMASQLDSVPLGNGTMLDQSCVMLLNQGGGEHHHGHGRHPAILIGSMGGKLQMGKYFRYKILQKEKKGERTLSDLFVTVAQAAGLNTNAFGKSSLNNGPLTEMMR